MAHLGIVVSFLSKGLVDFLQRCHKLDNHWSKLRATKCGHRTRFGDFDVPLHICACL